MGDVLKDLQKMISSPKKKPKKTKQQHDDDDEDEESEADSPIRGGQAKAKAKAGAKAKVKSNKAKAKANAQQNGKANKRGRTGTDGPGYRNGPVVRWFYPSGNCKWQNDELGPPIEEWSPGKGPVCGSWWRKGSEGEGRWKVG